MMTKEEKKFKLKKACEDVEELKDKNKKITEKLYLLTRRLYTLEVRNVILKYFCIIFVNF